MHLTRKLAPLAAALLVSAGLVVSGAVTDAAFGASGATRVVHGGDTAVLKAGTAGGELAPAVGPEAATAKVPVANRSQSSRARSTRDGLPLTGIPAASSAVAPATGATSFSGIDHHQQRLEVAGGNQWSTEPPDQALCAGGGQVFEAVNNAVAVYDTAGHRLALDSLNHFFGYPVEIDRATGLAGPKQTTDPTCLFDPTTGRFFLTILTYDSDTAGNPLPSGHNTLDTAVSPAGTAIGTWSVSHIDATDDGTGGTPSHPGCPCLGDYPHIGVDATGYYISTNEYPFFTDGFVGSQLYAMSKEQLASGATSVTVTQLDLSRADPHGNPGFTVWPAQAPDGGYATAAHGTQYFLSTDAAPEANGTGRSTDLFVWSLTNTSSLATTPNLGLHVAPLSVGAYTIPPPAEQKAGSTPLADCLNITACAKIVNGTPDKFKEQEAVLDSLDSRMQQVTYANGVLYGAHGTGLDVGSPAAQRAGVAWYSVRPTTVANGNLTASLTGQGRLAVAGNDLIDPALIVRPNGTGWLGVTLTGHDHYPSAAAVQVTTGRPAQTVSVLAEGVGPEDGFAAYRLFGARPRWGDYGAAAIDAGGRVWLGAEWIGQTCTLAQYQAAPFGQCGGTRTVLANWSTRISSFAG